MFDESWRRTHTPGCFNCRRQVELGARPVEVESVRSPATRRHLMLCDACRCSDDSAWRLAWTQVETNGRVV
jgi:hypothetical protein